MAATSTSGRSVVVVCGVSLGTADVTVTATDPGELSATQTFTVTVVRSADWGTLAIVYDELGGDDWTDNTNWNTDEPLASGSEWARIQPVGLLRWNSATMR